MNTNIVYPDYSNSIANLANSILKKWGLPTNGKTLELLDRYLAKIIRMWWLFFLMEWADALLSANLEKDGFFNTTWREHTARHFHQLQ